MICEADAEVTRELNELRQSIEEAEKSKEVQNKIIQ